MDTFSSRHPVSVIRPTKEQVRRWMEDRRCSSSPPPSQSEIRRQLGWELVHPETWVTR